MRLRLLAGAALLLALLLVSGCGETGAANASSENLLVSPQNTSLVAGINRISIALLDDQQNPVHATGVTVAVIDPNGKTVETRQLQNIGPQYGGIPVYVGTASFPGLGQYEYMVHARGAHDEALLGHAYVTVGLHSREVQVGARAPLVRQAILGDPGVTISTIDSGVPPDNWHSETVAAGVAQHRPMVLYFGDPAFCPSKTCGPTHQIVEQLCTLFCNRLLFEHIETYYPAGPPGPHAHVNPAFAAFGLQNDPWIYFVNASGVVSDRLEGPVTLSELVQSAEGTLAGKVPAVSLS